MLHKQKNRTNSKLAQNANNKKSAAKSIAVMRNSRLLIALAFLALRRRAEAQFTTQTDAHSQLKSTAVQNIVRKLSTRTDNCLL